MSTNIDIDSDLQNVEIVTKVNDTVTEDNSHIISPVENESIVEGFKREYSIVGDGLYASINAGDAPEWLTSIIDNLVATAILNGQINYDLLVQDVRNAIDAIDVAQNTYVEQVNITSLIDGIVVSRLETLNATLGNTYATRVALTSALATSDEAMTFYVTDLVASFNDAVNSRVTSVELAYADADSALSSSIDSLSSRITSQDEEVTANADAVSGLKTYVGIGNNNLPDGTGILSRVQVLENQNDGVIETTSGTYDVMIGITNPNTDTSDDELDVTKEPYASWITIDTSNSDDSVRSDHIGDVYIQYDASSGDYLRAFKFIKTAPDASVPFATDSEGYTWSLIADTDAAAAFIVALQARDLADQKRRVFVIEPFGPYDEGDLWVDSSSSPQVIKVANASRGTGYAAGEWSIADQQAQDFIDSVYTPDKVRIDNQIDGKIEYYFYETFNDPVTIAGIPSIATATDEAVALNILRTGWNTETLQDNANGNIVYFKDSKNAYWYQARTSLWLAIIDTSIYEALQDAADARGAADGRVSQFYAWQSNDVPADYSYISNPDAIVADQITEVIAGDDFLYWFKSDNILYYKPDTTWIPVPIGNGGTYIAQGDVLNAFNPTSRDHSYYTFNGASWQSTGPNGIVSNSEFFVSLSNDVRATTGLVATALSDLEIANNAYTDGEIATVSNSFDYDSTLIINGDYYNTGFGLNTAGSSSLTQPAGANGSTPATAFDSEFWINAERLVLKSPSHPLVSAAFTVTASGISLSTEFTEATRNNVTGSYSSATTYIKGDIVEHQGSSYSAKRTTVGDTPDTSPLDWQLFASRGIEGDSYTGTIEYYKLTNSATPPTIASGGWSTGFQSPTSSNQYLWNYNSNTRSIGAPIDSSVSLITQYVKDGKGIVTITEEYQLGTSPTTEPTGTWSTTFSGAGVISVASPYMWNRTTIAYTEGANTVTSTMIAARGGDGDSYTGTIEYYKLTNSVTAPTIASGSWLTVPQTPTSTNQYLWNYNKNTRSIGADIDSPVSLITQYVKDGKGITSITEEYQRGTSATTAPTSAWSGTFSGAGAISESLPYMWNRTTITYTEGAPTVVTTMIAARGGIGNTGPRGTAVLSYSADLGATTTAGAVVNIATYWNSAAPTALDTEIFGDTLVVTNTNATSGWTHIYQYGVSWTSSVAFTVNGNQVVTGTLSGDRLIAGTEISAPRISGGAIKGSVYQSIGTSYMSVQGDIFGPNDLIEWYGPTAGNVDGNGYAILANLNKSNSITWKDDLGNFFTRGTILSGTLSTSNQDASLTNNGIISTGNFSSNGGQIVIHCSVHAQFSPGLQNQNCPVSVNPTALVTLYDDADGGRQVDQQSFTGEFFCSPEGNGQSVSVYAVNGSFTFLDTKNNTSIRNYRLTSVITNVPLSPSQYRTCGLSILTQEVEGGGAGDGNGSTLLQATSTNIGGIELASDTIQTAPVTAITNTAGKTYGVQLNSSGQAVVNVPWSGGSVSNVNDATITIDAGTLLSGGGSFTVDQASNATITIDADTVALDARYLNVDTARGSISPEDGRYITSASSSVGTKIRLPFAANAGRMVSFTVRVYQAYQSYTLNFSGYLYNSAANNWYLPKCVMESGTNSIAWKMGRDTDGRAYVHLAGSNYRGISISNVTAGYISANWNSGWSYAITDTTPNIAASGTAYPPYSLNNPATTYDYAGATLTGALVYNDINVTNGAVTAVGTRTLTLANLGYVAPTSVTGNAGTVTNGVYTNTPQTISGAKTFTSRLIAKDLSFTQTQFNPATTQAHTGLNPMSMRLIDSYVNGGPTTYGTVLDIYGRSSHSHHQFNMYNGDLRFRYAFWQTDFGGWKKIWNETNDGSGSGLDADLLDGLHASSFARSTYTVGNFIIGNNTNGSLATRHIDGKAGSNNGSDHLYLNHSNGRNVYINGHLAYHANNIPTWNQNTTGNAATATWADTVDVNSTDTGSGNFSLVWHLNDTLYRSSQLYYNRDARRLTVPNITATLTGNASTATALTSGNKTINGSLTVAGGTNSRIYLADTNGTTRSIYCDSNLIGFLNSAGSWSLYSDNTGNVTCNYNLIGSTVRANSELHVGTNGSIFKVASTGSITTTGSIVPNVSGTTDLGNSQRYYRNLFIGPVTSYGLISTTSEVRGSTIKATSALKYKDIHKREELSDSLKKVCEIGSKGVAVGEFKDKAKGKGLHRWFIADEVDEVMPEVVGKIDGEIESLNYNEMIADAYAAIALLNSKIEQLEKPWYTKLWERFNG
jgi:hypothetical protein